MSFKCFHVKNVFLVSLVLALAATIFSQKPTPTPERDREIVALLANAQLAAPELAADTFLKVAASKRVNDPAWRKEILDEATRIAENAKYPVQLRPVPIDGIRLNNTQDYILVSALLQKLDTLSLKSRIIDQTLGNEKSLAKQRVFEMGGKLSLKRRSCEDMTTYEVGDVYSVVSKVAKAVFTERQVAEGQRALFLLPWIENIESPTQIAPALDLVSQFRTVGVERQMLTAAMAQALRRRFYDDRSFTSSVTWGNGLASKIGKLVSDEPEPAKAELSLAYREFLIKNLSDTRCKDNAITQEQLPQFIEAANKLFPQRPLTFDDIASTDQAGTVQAVDLLAKSAALQKLRTEVVTFKISGPDGRRALEADQTSPEWQAKVSEVTDHILSWNGDSGETESQVSALRAAMFLALLEEIKPGELRKSTVRKYLSVLDRTSMQTSNFIEWYYFVNQLRRSSPDLFEELAPEFANPNFKVMIEVKKLDTLQETKPQVKQ